MGMTQTQPGGATTMTTPLRDMHFGPDTPDWGSAFDLGEIPLVQCRYSVPKSRRIPVQLIRSHPVEGQTAPFRSFFQQFQANLWLGLVLQVFGDTTGTALFCMGLVKPLVRHEQLAFDQAVPFATGVPQIHPHLTVCNFAHRPTILCSHPNQSPPCLTTLDSSISTTPSASPSVSPTSR